MKIKDRVKVNLPGSIFHDRTGQVVRRDTDPFFGFDWIVRLDGMKQTIAFRTTELENDRTS